MTFTEIVASVGERLNLSSPEAFARIGRNVNDRYRRLTSSVGLQTARRSTSTQSTAIADSRITFDLEKLEVVYCAVAGKERVLDEITYDEWRQLNVLSPQSGDPEKYAIETTGASATAIVVYPTPAAVVAHKADGLANASTLSGVMVPAYPADYHDALVFGAMADEYSKMDKQNQAMQFEQQYEGRVSELRYFLAKSIYLSNHQGSRSRGSLMRPPDSWYK